MFNIELLKIDLKAINQGGKNFCFALNDGYFDAIQATDIRQGNLLVELSVQKQLDGFVLCFHICGFVIVTCDMCLDDMELPIDTTHSLVVRFGDEYSDEDELIVVPERDGIIDTSWFIYEFIELNMPIKHVHANGKCNAEMLRVLQEYSPVQWSETNKKESIDPRWDKLEKIKTTIKD